MALQKDSYLKSADPKFDAVKLLCPVAIQLLKQPSLQNARVFNQTLVQIDSSFIQELQAYIIYPIEVTLKNKNLSESLLMGLFEILYTLLDKSRILSMKIFYQLHSMLLTFLSQSHTEALLSEETNTEIIKITMLMLRVSDKKVLSEFYTLDYLPILAQQMTVLINIAKVDKSRDLQKLALDCMMAFMQADTDFGKTNSVELGDVFAHCLPGMVTGMVLIVSGNPNQGQAVYVKAMATCCHLLTLTISDTLLQESQERVEANRLKGIDPKDSIKEPLKVLYVERNQNWMKTTASHLTCVIQAFCGLASSSHWKVRQKVAEFAEQLLLTCSSSLSDSIHKLLESLVGLIHDHYESVSKTATAALEKFKSAQSGGPGEKSLTEILEENIFNLSASLPRLMKFCDEENKLHLIQLLQGYITLLGPNVSGFISSSPHLKRVCLVLAQVLEMETTDVRVVEERGSLLHEEPEVFTNSTPVNIWRPCKYFKHFRDDTVYNGLMDVCRLLGQNGNIYTLVDHMLDLYQESVLYKLPAILVINEMIVGASHPDPSTNQIKDPQLLKDVIKLLIDEYLSPSNLKLISDATRASPQSSAASTPTSLVIVEHDDQLFQKELNIANRNRAILLTCLFTEGLGKFATALGKNFQLHLIKGLYPLVENLGHENLYLSSTAYLALVEVALACGHSSLDQLIRDNADYLVTCVSQRLRHFDQHYRAPRTICVMLRYCSKDLLYQINHSITQLFESLDDNYTSHLVLFMPVLLELVHAIGRWFPASSAKQESLEKPVQGQHSLDSKELISRITEYTNNKLTAHGCGLDNECNASKPERSLDDIAADMIELQKEMKETKLKEEEEEMAEMEEEENVKKKPPKHVQIVQEVFKRIRNLMLCKEPNLRVMALDIVCQGCQDLADYERELLPQVHQLWPSLVAMFRQEEKFIVAKAMKTLVTLSRLSGDFMRSRVMKEIVPGVASYMEKQAKISCESRSAYLYTSNGKLQLCVLSSLGQLAENLKLDGNDLNALVNICLPYLCDLQPQALQQASLDSFYFFHHLEPDSLWFSLNMTYCPGHLTPPGPQFTPVKFPVHEKNSFSKNISFLLDNYYR